VVESEAGAAWAHELYGLAADIGVRPSDLVSGDPRKLAFDMSIKRGAREFRRFQLARHRAPNDMGVNEILAALRFIAGA